MTRKKLCSECGAELVEVDISRGRGITGLECPEHGFYRRIATPETLATIEPHPPPPEPEPVAEPVALAGALTLLPPVERRRRRWRWWRRRD